MKKHLSTPVATVALFALAVLLLGFGGINAIQAAPRIESTDYRAQVQLSNINVAIVENGSVVEDDGELLTKLAGADFRLGKKYDEVLSVRNTPNDNDAEEDAGIPEYVRVSVYRYWTDDTGKAVNLDPSLIRLNFLTDDGWTIDEAASTPERTVLYYAEPLEVGKETPAFADALTVDSAVATAVANGSYQYDNVSFHVKVSADAVQTHSGEEAMVSAWGRTNK